MKKNTLVQEVSEAIAACQDKKAEQITILELDKDSGAFTDYFLVCSGNNPRQVQAISDEVEFRLKKKLGLYPHQIEGYKQAEWILIDYTDFVVHVFAEKARKFYDLERLWKSAKRMEPAELIAAYTRKKAAKEETKEKPKTAKAEKVKAAKPKVKTKAKAKKAPKKRA